MKQADLGLNLSTKMTRKREFLGEMNRVVPWTALVELVASYAPEGRRGRPPFALETMLRVHVMQHWFGLSDPAMEEVLFDVPLNREFAQLDTWNTRLPNESTILRFCHLMEEHKLAVQILEVVDDLLAAKGPMLRSSTVVDATTIAEPTSTKCKSGKRDPQMHQSKKGQQWYFGMMAHIAVDGHSGLVSKVIGTAGKGPDVVEANSLFHGEETNAVGDAGDQGVGKRPDVKSEVTWHVAMRPGKRKTLGKTSAVDALKEKIGHIKASSRAKVEHRFRVVKRQFGYTKVRYRGLLRNTAQLTTLLRRPFCGWCTGN